MYCSSMEAGLNLIGFDSSFTSQDASHSKANLNVSNTSLCFTNVLAAARMHHFDRGEIICSGEKKRGREAVA